MRILDSCVSVPNYLACIPYTMVMAASCNSVRTPYFIVRSPYSILRSSNSGIVCTSASSVTSVVVIRLSFQLVYLPKLALFFFTLLDDFETDEYNYYYLKTSFAYLLRILV